MAASLTTHAHLIRHLAAILALVCAAWLLPATQAHAQTNPLTPAPAAPKQTAADIETLIKTLDDPKARDQLKQQLELLLKAQGGGSGTPEIIEEKGLGAQLLSTVSHHVESISNALVNLVEAIADMPNRMQRASLVLADPAQRAYWVDVIFDLFGVLASAFIAAWAGRRVMTRARERLAEQRPTRWLVKLLYLPLIFAVEVVPTVAFALMSSVALPLFHPNEHAARITAAIAFAQVATMLTAVCSATLLTPRAPGLRLIRMTDETAAYAQVWVRRLAVVGFYGYAVTELASVIGVDPSLRELMSRVWGLLLAAMAVIVVLQNRQPVARWIAGGPIEAHADAPHDEPIATPLPDPDTNGRSLRFRAFRRQAAKLWHILAIAYIVAGYAVWSLQIEGGFAFLLRATVLTAILFAVLRLADTFLRQIFDRSFALPEDVKRFLPGLENRTNRYLPILKKALLIGLYLAGLFALLQVWGFDIIGWLSEGSGRPVMAATFKILIIVLLAGVLSEAVNLGIEHYLRDTDAQGRRIYHSGRMRTLLPLLRNAFRITLGVMVLLTVLSEIGLDIAPLLAAAGVVGLAIGFGAQTLVKDIITGVFILLEDTIAIGDVVDLGGHAGVVEGMTIRTIRLRDGAGAVHTVPFSAVTIIQNLTKDFSYATFDVKVDYRESVDKVIETIKKVGGEIEKDPSFRYGLLGTTEIIGLDSLANDGVTVKARMKTRAMSQWDVMRAFNLRLKRAFDDQGMLFAGVMAAMAAAPAKVKPEADDKTETKDASPSEPTQSPDTPMPAARPEGKTIVPPR